MLLFCLMLSYPAVHADTEAPAPSSEEQSPACSAFNALNTLIRDSRIPLTRARKEIMETLADIRTEYYLRDGRDYRPSEWIFPVAGYSITAINQGKGHGYSSRGYDYFSGNRHGGHPAYDIFIRDRNQDSMDDRSGRPAEVLSMTGGIVVALAKEWQPGSLLRGGKYLWVYDPANNLLAYYAHNQEIFVDLGMIVKPGDRLATIGRSGLNAAKHRSPTHLHFSVLRIGDGTVVPIPVYEYLRHSRTFQNR